MVGLAHHEEIPIGRAIHALLTIRKGTCLSKSCFTGRTLTLASASCLAVRPVMASKVLLSSLSLSLDFLIGPLGC